MTMYTQTHVNTWIHTPTYIHTYIHIPYTRVCTPRIFAAASLNVSFRLEREQRPPVE